MGHVALALMALLVGSDVKPIWPPAATATNLGTIKGTGAATACTGTQKMTGWGADGTMSCAADQTGAVTMTTVEIDFGVSATFVNKTSVTDAGVNATTRILAFQLGIAATGRQADENEMDALVCRGIPGAGSFTLICNSGSPTHGKFKVGYTLG